MLTNYQPFIDRVIHRYEGGYGWNKKDPGGPTKYGITCYDLAAHRHERMSSMSAWVEPVKALELSEAEVIYRTKYALAVRFDDLPSGVDAVMLDYGINSGCGRPIRVARRLVGLPDGGFDVALHDRLQTCNAKKFITAMNEERIKFMHTIRGGTAWAEFGHGWGARVADLETYCQRLAAKVATQEDVDLTQIVTPKATNVAKTATSATAGGAIASTGGMFAAGQPWTYALGAGAATIAGGILYELWQEHRANYANNLVHV